MDEIWGMDKLFVVRMTSPNVSGTGEGLGITQRAIPWFSTLRFVLNRFMGESALVICW